MLTMENLEEIKARLLEAVPESRVEIVKNPAVPAQSSLLADPAHALSVARFLRDTEGFDYCSNVTGVDWLDRVEKSKVKEVVGGVETEKVQEQTIPGYLEAVYHLYSIQRRQGPLVLRIRTSGRGAEAVLPSLTPVFRSAEFQEREIFDLYGIRFEGHPDLRRILMWDEFQDYPMRKDYVSPDDYDYEPTAHDAVLKRANEHASRAAAALKEGTDAR